MRRVARGFLVVVSILDGVLGLVCGLLLVSAPDGRFLHMEALRQVIGAFPLANTFFRDFLWIGVAMLLALGIPNAVAAVMLLGRRPGQYVATLVAAILLILWCGFELIYMFNGPAVGYLVVAIISVACSVVLMRSPETAS
jgi:hypothetical protein